MRTIYVLVALAIVALSICPRDVSADLPVHCLIEDVVGEWELSLSGGGQSKDVECSTSTDSYASGNFHLGDLKPEVISKINLTLQHPNIATVKEGGKVIGGSFTTIYDEGFEVRLEDGRVFFSFFNFKLASQTYSGKAESICNETKPGTFHAFGNPDGATWGCWKGAKLFGKEMKSSTTFIDVADTGRAKMYTLEGEKMYQPEHQLVDHINSNQDKYSFQATIYPQFLDMNMNHMHAMGGQKLRGAKANIARANKTFDFKSSMAATFIEENGKSATAFGETLKEELNIKLDDHRQILNGKLPESVDWRNMNGINFLEASIDQGSCGSCYSVATTAMISARTRIKYGSALRDMKAFVLTPQKTLSCSEYAQGCAGGFPFLVSKYTYDFGQVISDKFAYTGDDSKCPDGLADMKQVRAKNYGYIGGFYGACNAEEMMREIATNGPITIGFQVPPSLFHYRSGVFNAYPEKQAHEKMIGAGGKEYHVNKWEETNHAVLAVGYGAEADGTPYWIVQNSWGSWWGDKGYFKIHRGSDNCAFESMAVWAEPEIVDANLVQESALQGVLSSEDRDLLNMLDLGADMNISADEWATMDV